MSATNHTPHYDLPQFSPNDIPQWIADITPAFAKIDEAIYEASQTGGEDEEAREAAANAQNTANIANSLAQSTATLVDSLKESTDTLDEEITTLKPIVTSNTQKVDKTVSDIATINQELVTLQNNVNTSISKLTTDVSALNNDVVSNRNAISSINTQISSINSQISSIQTDLNKLFPLVYSQFSCYIRDNDTLQQQPFGGSFTFQLVSFNLQQRTITLSPRGFIAISFPSNSGVKSMTLAIQFNVNSVSGPNQTNYHIYNSAYSTPSDSIYTITYNGSSVNFRFSYSGIGNSTIYFSFDGNFTLSY